MDTITNLNNFHGKNTSEKPRSFTPKTGKCKKYNASTLQIAILTDKTHGSMYVKRTGILKVPSPAIPALEQQETSSCKNCVAWPFRSKKEKRGFAGDARWRYRLRVLPNVLPG
jgi:hypothetical protein